jgi:hypothetical protein
LAAAADAFLKAMNTGGPALTDAATLRPAILEQLARDGAPKRFEGEKWFNDLVDAAVVGIGGQIAAMQADVASSPPSSSERPDSLLAAYGVATFLGNNRHYKALGRTISDAIYATAVELGPGVSVSEMEMLIRWWVDKMSRATPPWRDAIMAAINCAGRVDTGDVPYNLPLTEHEFFAVAGALDASRGA